nr:hypothetical protein ZK430.6 - Caenorhabditis elegans [Caenorhabditis elegans]
MDFLKRKIDLTIKRWPVKREDKEGRRGESADTAETQSKSLEEIFCRTFCRKLTKIISIDVDNHGTSDNSVRSEEADHLIGELDLRNSIGASFNVSKVTNVADHGLKIVI